MSAAMPEVSGVSDHPSVANQPGVGIRYQRTADGRMPPKAGRATSGHWKSSASCRLAGSINANAIRASLRWVQERIQSRNGDGPVEIEAVTIGRKGRDGMDWLAHARLGFNYRLSEINAAVGVIALAFLLKLIFA